MEETPDTSILEEVANVERVRAKLVKSYLIFYEEKGRNNLYLAIWDGRRNPEQAPCK